MQEYISKQQQILRPAEQIYAVISRFDNLTPAVADKVAAKSLAPIRRKAVANAKRLSKTSLK